MATDFAQTHCRNPRCLEALDPEDQATMARLAAHGFCPLCRVAIALGVKAGAALVGGVSFLAAVLTAFANWWWS